MKKVILLLASAGLLAACNSSTNPIVTSSAQVSSSSSASLTSSETETSRETGLSTSGEGSTSTPAESGTEAVSDSGKQSQTEQESKTGESHATGLSTGESHATGLSSEYQPEGFEPFVFTEDNVNALLKKAEKTANASIEAFKGDHAKVNLALNDVDGFAVIDDIVTLQGASYLKEEYDFQIEHSGFNLEVGAQDYMNINSDYGAAVYLAGMDAYAKLTNFDLNFKGENFYRETPDSPLTKSDYSMEFDLHDAAPLAVYLKDGIAYAKYSPTYVNSIMSIISATPASKAEGFATIMRTIGAIFEGTDSIKFGIFPGYDDPSDPSTRKSLANMLKDFVVTIPEGVGSMVAAFAEQIQTVYPNLEDLFTFKVASTKEHALGFQFGLNRTQLGNVADLLNLMFPADESGTVSMGQAIKAVVDGIDEFNLQLSAWTDSNFVLSHVGIDDLSIEIKNPLAFGGVKGYDVINDQLQEVTHVITGKGRLGLSASLDLDFTSAIEFPEDLASYTDKATEINALIALIAQMNGGNMSGGEAHTTAPAPDFSDED